MKYFLIIFLLFLPSIAYAYSPIPDCHSTNQALTGTASNQTFGCVTISGTGSPGGTSGQIQYNNAGAFGGFTMSGDATSNTTTGALTLSPVNSNIGSFTNANITVNGKGLVTAATNGGAAGITLGTSASVTNPQRTSDATTGLFSPAVNTVAISEGGSEAMRINASGVGIGTTVPGAPLEVDGTGTSTGWFVSTGAVSASGGSGLSGMISLEPTASGQRLGFLTFGRDSSGTAFNSLAIQGFTSQAWTDNSAEGSYLTFSTTPNNSATRAEVMRLDQNGNVGIGSTTPNSALDISQKTSAVSLPAGTTAQRPSPIVGMIRYNSDVPALEAYYGSAWNTLGSGGGGSTPGYVVQAAASYEREFQTGSANMPDQKESNNLTAKLNAARRNQSLFLGYQAGQVNTATQNTFLGYQAGSSDTSGNSNTAIGYQAGTAITIGATNTFLGNIAGSTVTTASNDVCIGYNAQCAPTGSSNTVIGANTNATISASILIGQGVSSSGASGSGDIIIGGSATNGNGNEIAIGGTVTCGGCIEIGGFGSKTTDNNFNTIVIGGGPSYNGNGGITLGGTAGNINISGANNLILGNGVANTVLTSGANNILIGSSNAITTSSSSESNSVHIGGTGGDWVHVTGADTNTTEITQINGGVNVKGNVSGTVNYAQAGFMMSMAGGL